MPLLHPAVLTPAFFVAGASYLLAPQASTQQQGQACMPCCGQQEGSDGGLRGASAGAC